MRLESFLLSILVLSVLGCAERSDRPSGERADESPAVTVQEDGAEGAGDVIPLEGKQGAGYIWSGTMTIFGVRLPTGMKPVSPAPPKVHRFEGMTPLHQTFQLLRRQVTSYEVVEESGGYLLRHAVPRKRDKSSGRGSPPVMALRLSKREGGGVVVDVWLEQDLNKAPQHAENSAYKVPQRASSNYQSRRAERINETMRVFGKIQRGEPLTEEDYNSDYFK